MKRYCDEEGCDIYTYLGMSEKRKPWRCKEHAECADGETYEHERDHERIAAQRGRVKAVMQDGTWHTLGYIESKTGDPQASISARLRDLRKTKFGGHTVDRQYAGEGLWEYRMVVTDEQGVLI